jgi:MraZ protein
LGQIVGNCGELFQKETLLFKGQFLYSIDSKGRISIPAKLRKNFSPGANDSLVMTQGFGTCIDIYPYDQWQLIEEKLTKLNQFSPKDAMFIRMFLQLAAEGSLDSQSRILIPQNLLDYAKIEKEVLILGALKKIEVWNPKLYEEYLKQSKETYELIAQEVMSL